MKEKILIIGGGVGGLFTGAILAKEGHIVTVLEKNPTIGGGLQTFKYKGETFETGMHVLGGFQPGGTLNKICNYLGILDQLDIQPEDEDSFASITYLSEKKTYRMGSGRERFIEQLAKEFPSQRDNLTAYINELYSLADEVDLFYLRKGSDRIFSHSERFFWAADELISHFIDDKRLRDLLGFMNPMYGGMAHHTPAYIHALINVLYIEGSSRFVGGSQQLADALEKIICNAGGEVLRNKMVSEIKIEDRTVQYVETTDSSKYRADRYISAIHPCALLKLTDEKAFPKSYRDRLNDIPNVYSAFTVYIIFKKDKFPFVNHTCYIQQDYGQVWTHGTYDGKEWPRGFMFFTPAEKKQGEYAHKMIINSLMSFDSVRKWEDTTVGHRGADYLEWKQQHLEQVLNRMTEFYPEFRDTIDVCFASSPLTIRDFYNEKEGALYGFRKDCQNMALSQVSIYTKVSNLLLTGQNINLHGICGVPLTAINTAEAIVGEDVIIDKINNAYNAYDE